MPEYLFFPGALIWIFQKIPQHSGGTSQKFFAVSFSKALEKCITACTIRVFFRKSFLIPYDVDNELMTFDWVPRYDVLKAHDIMGLTGITRPN